MIFFLDGEAQSASSFYSRRLFLKHLNEAERTRCSIEETMIHGIGYITDRFRCCRIPEGKKLKMIL